MSDEYGDYGSSGREAARVADVLRARMTDAYYPLNSMLPTQRDLAREFGVSRDTVQRVLRELTVEGWIVQRQGSGSRVVRAQEIHSPTSSKRPDHTVTLGTLISRAFDQSEVALDVFTLSSESLDAHVRLQVERIRSGVIAPQHIALRVLMPDVSLDFPYWRTSTADHDQLLKDRFVAITNRHVASLHSVIGDLKSIEVVPFVDFEVRRVRLVPAFKLYLVNGEEALFGTYKVFKRPITLDDGEEVETTDVLGLGAGLTHYVKGADPYSRGTVFFDEWQAWFDSVWEFLAFN
ncbi:winged helix-turn-helix domain-containing protein [Streptomyces chartreusis]|uniref:winged helix-turn-helix domain-containing protein n=1 Tax=Streptomyces chartreusis TaxID=1969 RepID=UPI002E8220F9|nr:winged helix-turn-helix domain-containing protein [Streptomyces chartreusis]WUB19508.1 winged helix-turn-helix domain-containing protein [Streptomyces chartreusis]